jgi:hypothetical protein
MTTDTCGCTTTTTDCGLPATPFEALKVSYGMLLREDDFTVLMGNPRGKQMLHNGWLHRSGVVWGYDVRIDGTKQLTVSEGLAVDARGRELLRQTAQQDIDLGRWVREEVPAQAATASATTGNQAGYQGASEPGCETSRQVHACLYASFACCPSAPVQTLADPCDVERRHDAYSRVVESARLSLVIADEGECCCASQVRPYHRVRVLLGLDEVAGDEDHAGRKAAKARRKVARKPVEQRPRALLAAFRRLAAADGADIRPPSMVDPADGSHPVRYADYPSADDDSARVPLACVTITVIDSDGCPTIEDAVPDMGCRTTLLPTAVIQELSCALAPALIDARGADEQVGPRAYTNRIEWSPDLLMVTIPVDGRLNRGSVGRSAVQITSLSETSWVTEDLDWVRYDPDYTDNGAVGAVLVRLADRPVNRLVRLVIKGTGPKPIYGVDPAAPLAGAMDGPPATRHDGHDVVVTWPDLTARSTAAEPSASEPEVEK